MGAFVAGLLCPLYVVHLVLPEAVGHMHRVPPVPLPGRRFVLPDNVVSAYGMDLDVSMYGWMVRCCAGCAGCGVRFVSLSESV